MNFGYRHSDPAIEVLPLLPEDEPDRSAIQLYHHVLGGMDLNGRDVLDTLVTTERLRSYVVLR